MDVGLIQVFILSINLFQGIICLLYFGTNDHSNSTIKIPASTGSNGEPIATPSRCM